MTLTVRHQPPPHREKPAETLDAIASFADQIFRVHHEGIENAA